VLDRRLSSSSRARKPRRSDKRQPYRRTVNPPAWMQQWRERRGWGTPWPTMGPTRLKPLPCRMVLWIGDLRSRHCCLTVCVLVHWTLSFAPLWRLRLAAVWRPSHPAQVTLHSPPFAFPTGGPRPRRRPQPRHSASRHRSHSKPPMGLCARAQCQRCTPMSVDLPDRGPGPPNPARCSPHCSQCRRRGRHRSPTSSLLHAKPRGQIKL
jgi:hypothetical protein